jgi:hypothetical protein
MNSGALVWLVLFAVAAICFFSIAAIVAVKGTSDLKDLLSGSGEKSNDSESVL